VTATRPAISVCIVTGRRLRLLDDCLASLQRQEAALPFELLVLSDGDHEVAEAVHARFPSAKVGLVHKAHPGAARNWLVAEAAGDLLLFLDDDVTVEPQLLAELGRLADEHPDAAVLGGPNETPAGSTAFQFVQGAVLASMVGAGPVRRRYGRHPAGPADESFFTLCNLAVRRAVMVAFEDDLLCAEENAVLAELAERGVQMHYDPRLVAYHDRRADWRGFAQQMHKYGRGRGQLMRGRPRTFRLAYVAPSLLVSYLLVLPLLCLWSAWTAAGLVLYATAVCAQALKIGRSLRRAAQAPLAAVLVVVLHLCYGTGVVRGAVRPRRRLEHAAPVWVTAGDSPS
jgi:glycosyltransferase involved in cell wall biosynthesis